MGWRNSRRALVIVFLFTALLMASVVWFFRKGASEVAGIRNVVLISIDTCRADRFGCYGQARRTTPNIDAVAREGVIFANAQTTNPITLPAHCSMLTGTNPLYHRVHDNNNYRLSDSSQTLAEILRDNGYQTAAFVGAFVLNAKFGLDQGFETYNDDMVGSLHTDHATPNERRASDVSAAATKWLESHHHDPFFLFLHYFDPHDVYRPPEPFASTYAADLYAGEIAYTDHCIGRVIAKLKSLDIYESTLVIITADHAESLGEHGENTHSFFIYQSTMHVPLIVRAPEGVRGKKIDAPVGIVDVLPTVLGFLGTEVPNHIQGVDLSPHINGEESTDRERFIYLESLYPTKYDCGPVRGLVSGNWKYIWTVRPELYDLRVDPQEANNVVDDHPQIAQKLGDRLKHMIELQVETRDSNHVQPSDAETLERLRSLGYVGKGAVDTAPQIDPDAEDPKDFAHINKRITSAYGLIKRNEFEAARSVCLELIAERPTLLDAHFILGLTARSQNRHADAIAHFSRYLAMAATSAISTGSGRMLRNDVEFADVHVQLGRSLFTEKRPEAAMGQFLRALEIVPDHPGARSSLITVQSFLGERKKSHEERLKIKTDESHSYFAEALEMLNRGEYVAAREKFRKSGQLNPKGAIFMNNLAWTMATHRDADVRKPKHAVLLAEVAAELTTNDDAKVLDTLAAAYAATGDFELAKTTIKKAIVRATEDRKEKLADLFRERLQYYEKSEPYYESPGKTVSHNVKH